MPVNAEITINARGLSAPGPRLMVETHREKRSLRVVRVVVSSQAAADDLRDHYTAIGASITSDEVGGEIHVVIDFNAD